MKKTKWLAVCMAAMMVLFAAGCKNSSDGPDSVPVEKVTLDKTTLTLSVGGTATLKATVEPDDADDKTVTWSSSDEAFVTVDKDGKVTAVAEGTATITAKAGSKSATCEITVTSVAVNSVELNPTTLTLTVGKTEELNVRILPSEASDVTVTWYSSNEAVATVDKDGKVTAAKAGSATITAKASDKTATCEVSVNVHTHYYDNFKCTTCELEKPYLEGGKIDNWGKLTEYKGNATELDIPEGVTSIEVNVFKDCTSLTKVTIPESVTEIGWYAFYGCTNLKSVTIPGSVTSIEYAFKGCTSLTEVTIPDSVTNIHSAFEGCTGLTSVTMDDGVKTIGSRAFEGCTSLASVTIPASVTEIGSYAFYGCTSLASVTIPASVTEIGRLAFYECTSLASVTYKGTKAQWNAIEGSDDVNITRIDCSDVYIGVKEVPEYLKMSGTTVTGYTDGIPANLVIPDGVTKIGKGAFYDCTTLESVTIPGSVTEIESLGTSSSDHGAFEECTKLTTVTMGDGVKTIGSSAFSRCKSLASVTIPASVTTIGSSAFYGCTGLTSVTIPASVTTIGNYAFDGCTGLTSVTIPASVTTIGSGAFYGCTGLTSVTIPASVTTIGNYAFYGCTGLTSVTIPASVTTIGNYAFDGCTGLTSVTIPASVTTIEYSAFSHCTKLTSVNYGGTKEQWKAIEKGSAWNFNTGDYTIQCTDGKLDKKGNDVE